MIKYIVGILIAGFLCGCNSFKFDKNSKTGQQSGSLTKTVCVEEKLDYLLYIPEDYNLTKKDYPLVLFLHGAGERGSDLEKIKVHGPPKLVASGNKFPFILISPQCPENRWWGEKLEILMLNNLVDYVAANYRVDKRRIYITGLSMGGFGSWALAAKYPDKFAAIAPICGGGNPQEIAKKLRKTPVWAFHGQKDQVVKIDETKEIISALKKAGNKAKFTVYPDKGHDCWTVTYDNPKFYDWLLSNTLPK